MTGQNDKTRAVVLSGGGANGAYEAGCLKAIFGGHSPATGKQPVEADIFTGTSVGSFNPELTTRARIVTLSLKNTFSGVASGSMLRSPRKTGDPISMA